eukprot:2830585-Rhodomonas_salina.2
MLRVRTQQSAGGVHSLQRRSRTIPCRFLACVAVLALYFVSVGADDPDDDDLEETCTGGHCSKGD